MSSLVRGFQLFQKKSLFDGQKRGPRTGIIILSLKARLGGSTFGIPKNRCVKLPVGSSMCPPPLYAARKNGLLCYGRTDERTDGHFLFCTLERNGASRKNVTVAVAFR